MKYKNSIKTTEILGWGIISVLFGIFLGMGILSWIDFLN